jgi:hypothetical protein
MNPSLKKTWIKLGLQYTTKHRVFPSSPADANVFNNFDVRIKSPLENSNINVDEENYMYLKSGEKPPMPNT